MKRNPLGQTGMQVSALGWGTVKLGRDQKLKYPEQFVLPDDEQVLHLLGLVAECGINLIDTAPAYGTSEERLGKLLKKRRQDWVISTKVGEEFVDGESTFDFTAGHLRFSVERSLRRLRSDYLDLVLVHSDGNDSDIIERYEVFDTLAELKRAGWIRAFGMSSKTLEGGLLTAKYADVVMVTYNPRDREELAVIEACQRQGKGVLIKKALASGHLTARSVTEQDPDAKQIAARQFDERENFSGQHKHANPEQNGAADHHPANAQDTVQTSFNLVLNQPGVSSAIVGTINPQHLRDNVSKALIALNLNY